MVALLLQEAVEDILLLLVVVVEDSLMLQEVVEAGRHSDQRLFEGVAGLVDCLDSRGSRVHCLHRGPILVSRLRRCQSDMWALQLT